MAVALNILFLLVDITVLFFTVLFVGLFYVLCSIRGKSLCL